MKARWSTIAFAILVGPGALVAQDSNIFLPVDDIERILRHEAFEVVDIRTARGLPSERTYSTTVRSPEGDLIRLQLAPAPEGGEGFNNRPQYEIAAYEIQKLFLEPEEYVVPPTVARCFNVGSMREMVARADQDREIYPTFEDWPPVTLSVLQYWLWNVDVPEKKQILDEDRMKEDEVFERNVANFNILTYLIRHRDGHDANFVMSTDPESPRVFSIDNGVAFESDDSDRGDYWRRIRVDRLPARAIERLRQTTLADVQDRLGTMAEFTTSTDGVVQVEPTASLDPDVGVRKRGAVVQIGLTEFEIERVFDRIQDLIKDVDDGDYELF